MPHPCPIQRKATGNHGAEREPRTTTAPDQLPGQGPFHLAVGVGFEPTVTCATTVFKTVPLGRSGNPPRPGPPGAERVQRTGREWIAGGVVHRGHWLRSPSLT